ncbi:MULTISPECIES: sensor histidine kinase [Pseudacidovorax]|uniref:sensor histidine kinase n=1 Tax=Pseudacidovorax TaxID=433923 RepID=UPI001F26D38B|nr:MULTISPECIES: sensor histidine kinase [Pseudacidovorax]
MRLADFLDQNKEEILREAAAFAKTLPTLKAAADETLRDHFSQCLNDIASDLRRAQSRTEAYDKSQGLAPKSPVVTAAEEHGEARAQSGLTVSQLISEYRALRATIIALWLENNKDEVHVVDDLVRFNEAIDQAVAESTEAFEAKVEHWRHIFIGVIGHDLRAPLNAISLTAKYLQGILPSEAKSHVLTISNSSKRIGTMLDSLLDYSSSRGGAAMTLKKSNANLSKELLEELQILRAAFPQQEISLDVIQTIEGTFDVSRLREAFANLLSNAAEHGTGGVVKAKVKKSEDAAVIQVCNEGKIADEKLEGIFDPLKRGQGFETGHRTNLGLGLFICKQIALAHGGDIVVKSDDGIVLFTLTIPLHQAD